MNRLVKASIALNILLGITFAILHLFEPQPYRGVIQDQESKTPPPRLPETISEQLSERTKSELKILDEHGEEKNTQEWYLQAVSVPTFALPAKMARSYLSGRAFTLGFLHLNPAYIRALKLSPTDVAKIETSLDDAIQSMKEIESNGTGQMIENVDGRNIMIVQRPAADVERLLTELRSSLIGVFGEFETNAMHNGLENDHGLQFSSNPLAFEVSSFSYASRWLEIYEHNEDGENARLVMGTDISPDAEDSHDSDWWRFGHIIQPLIDQDPEGLEDREDSGP